MPESVMFHDGNRRLQDQFDSRRIADRLEEKLTRSAFTDQDRGFIEAVPFFFLASADDRGRADCSFKGGLLFIDMGDKPRRLRVNGTASVGRDDPLMPRFAGAQLLVRVTVRAIFPNCPRYIVSPGSEEPSKYAPRPGHVPPEPAWKGFDDFKDYVHPRQPTPSGD